MADRPSTSASRVGRPRTRSAHQLPCVLVVGSKVSRFRFKSAHANKITDTSKKTKVKKTPVNPKQAKVAPLLEQRVIEIYYDNSDIEFPFHPDKLPDLPPVELDQPNLSTEQQNQEANLPPIQEQPNQEPNQVPNVLPDQPNQPNQPNNLPPNLPTQMANPQQLNWS